MRKTSSQTLFSSNVYINVHIHDLPGVFGIFSVHIPADIENTLVIGNHDIVVVMFVPQTTVYTW